jgi:cell division protease FtsH
MKIHQDVIDSISEKEIKLNELKIELKSEYVGIEDVIDQIILSITPYYIFPESLKKPLIVNLWGMTGTGKTSVVEKIIDFLGLRKQYVKYDMGEYSGTSSLGLRYELSRQVSSLEGMYPVFLFDEFQLGRTIDDDQKESNSPSSRVLWELLDSGIIYVNDNDNTSDFFELMLNYKRCCESNIVLDADGYINKEHTHEYHKLMDISRYNPRDYRIATVTEDGTTQDMDRDMNETVWSINDDGKTYRFENPRFMRESDFDTLFKTIPEYFNNNPNFEINFIKHFKGKTIKAIYAYIQNNILANVSFLKPKNYSKSLIFCLGNLDETYGMSHSLDPDSDADMFYEHSLKITLPDVKKALSTRFRMEQIARLGNNHIIYPSLNKSAYTRYIDMYFDKISKEFKETYDSNIEFDSSIKKMIYGEGVYPSQGIRPLISTFNTYIQSYIPHLIHEIIKEDVSWINDISTIKWSYMNKQYVFDISDKTYRIDVGVCLEKLRESDNSNKQALVAVHEAGHAIVGAIQMKIAPTFIYTKTLDNTEGKCVYNDFADNIQTYGFLKDKIQLLYGGIIAEKLVFGEDFISVGASSDLSELTHIAVSIHKNYGFVNHFKNMREHETDIFGYNLLNIDCSVTVRSFLETLYHNTYSILKENKDILIKLSKILTEKSRMDKTEFEEFMNKHKEIVFNDSYNDYRKMLFSC